MKKINFPFLALGIGLLLMLFIIEGSSTDAAGTTRVSLLTLLVFNECAFILTAAGVYVGLTHYRQVENRLFYIVTTVLCGLLASMFMLQGIKLWPL